MHPYITKIALQWFKGGWLCCVAVQLINSNNDFSHRLKCSISQHYSTFCQLQTSLWFPHHQYFKVTLGNVNQKACDENTGNQAVVTGSGRMLRVHELCSADSRRERSQGAQEPAPHKHVWYTSHSRHWQWVPAGWWSCSNSEKHPVDCICKTAGPWYLILKT